MKNGLVLAAVVIGMLFVGVAPSIAQDAPAPPPKDWTTTAGVGFAMTSGNSDTSTSGAVGDDDADAIGGRALEDEGLHKPPTPDIEKNDVSVIVAFVFKN